MEKHLEAPRGNVCFVAGGAETLGGPLGIGERREAVALAARGQRVHFLWCGPAVGLRPMRRALEAAGVHLSRLDEIPLPPGCRAPNGTPGCGPALYTSNLIRYAVEALQRVHGFRAVVFPAWQAAGFRCVQAKRAGAAFGDVNLVVRLDCVGQWLREADKRWPEADDLFLDYCERYTFENADIPWIGSSYMEGEALRLGWVVPPDGCADGTTGPAEVVFVGGPDSSDALDVFLDAVDQLDSLLPIRFLNPTGSRRVSQRVGERMKGRPHTICSGLDRRRALEFLAEGNRLAVVCDRAETVPPLVRDCIVHGLPFLAVRPRWLPGRVRDAVDPGPGFLDADAADSADHLAAAVRSWCDRVPDGAEDGLEAILRPPPPTAAPCFMASSPVATVAVTYYNLGRYLPETLASLAAQSCSDLEVLVLDDGSTCEQSRRVWDEQRRLYPQFRFLRQANAGLGAARNRALREARAPYFIPVDADNVAAPGMVDAFVRAMQRDPGASALTCFFLAFREFDDIEKGKFLHQVCPTGGPQLAACAYNVYGDANAVFRTDDLRAAGGFTTDRSTYCHDWEAFVKLVRGGRRVGVVPEYLFYYRRRPDAMSAVMTRGGTDVYPFVQRMLATFFGGEDVEAGALWAVVAGSLLRPARRESPPWTFHRLGRGAVRRAVAVGQAIGRWALRIAGRGGIAPPLLRPAPPTSVPPGGGIPASPQRQARASKAVSPLPGAAGSRVSTVPLVPEPQSSRSRSTSRL